MAEKDKKMKEKKEKVHVKEHKEEKHEAKKEKPVKEKRKLFAKKEKVQAKTGNVQPMLKHVRKRKSQRAFEEKKAKLVVKGRQTKWAPVWVVIKKHGMGKRIHPSAMTKYRRNWRRNKLKIKPRKVRKWHMG